MPRNGSGVYSLPGGSTITNGDTSDASDINTPLADLVSDANAARPIVAGGTGATSASAARTALGLTIGTDVQAQDAGLTSIAGLTTAADKMIYTTASDTYAVADLTTAGRALLDDADAAAQRTTLGAAPLASPTFTGVPAAPTAATGTDTTQVATTAYVVDEIPNQLNATGTAPIFACRAWGLVDASSGTPVVSGSGNVASITDVGDGEYQINFTTALPSAAYAVVCSCKDVDDNGIAQSDRTLVLPYSLATGSFRVRTAAAEGGARDVEILTFAVFG